MLSRVGIVKPQHIYCLNLLFCPLSIKGNVFCNGTVPVILCTLFAVLCGIPAAESISGCLGIGGFFSFLPGNYSLSCGCFSVTVCIKCNFIFLLNGSFLFNFSGEINSASLRDSQIILSFGILFKRNLFIESVICAN